MYRKLRQLVIVFYVFVLCCCVWTTPVNAEEQIKSDVLPAAQLIKEVQSGGYILYMRHSVTDHRTKDKLENTLASCNNQRVLSAEGRTQAKKIGRAIKALNIPVGRVSSSPFCRCKETAKLSFGEFKIDLNLKYSMTKDKEESRRLSAYLLRTMKASVVDATNTVYVGHTSNLKDALGIWPKPEGVIIVFQKRQGEIFFRGIITPDDWPKK